jgi:inner membrane protein
MLAPNHIAFGILFTGTFAAIGGQNIFADPSHLAIATFAALLPDIDNPKAAVGWVLRPVSRWIFVHYGHRTLTHSLLALGLATGFFHLLPADFTCTIPGLGAHTWHHPPTQFFLWGYASHLLLDMCTLQGIALFFPFRKNPCVMPGNPAYRVRTGDVRTETVFFFIFVGLCLFLQPLFKNGWWTSYNRFFANLRHLDSEQRKTADLLQCQYILQEGSLEHTGTGVVAATTETRAVLIENNRFVVLDDAKQVVKQVLPAHTGLPFGSRDTQFAGLTEMEVNRLFAGKYVLSADFQSSDGAFEVSNAAGPPAWKGVRYKSDYVSGLYIHAAYDSTRTDSVFYQESPRIRTLYEEIRIERGKDVEAHEAWQNALVRLHTLRQTATQTTDLYERERLTREADALQRSAREPENHDARILELLAQIDQERRTDARNLAGKLARNGRKTAPAEIRFSGSARFFWYGKPP